MAGAGAAVTALGVAVVALLASFSLFVATEGVFAFADKGTLIMTGDVIPLAVSAHIGFHLNTVFIVVVIGFAWAPIGVGRGGAINPAELAFDHLVDVTVVGVAWGGKLLDKGIFSRGADGSKVTVVGFADVAGVPPVLLGGEVLEAVLIIVAPTWITFDLAFV